MIHAPLSTTAVLDESTEVVATAGAPWAGLVILTALPLRYLEAIFLDHLFELGGEASHYGNLLGATSYLIVAALLFAICGRAIYARACRLALASGRSPGREAASISMVALASYVLTASASVLIGYATLFTCIGFIVAVIFGGLAIGTMELNERVSLDQPFRLIFRYTKHLRIPIGLTLVFFCGIFVALVNLAGAISIVRWAVTAIGLFDAPHWPMLFENNRRFTLALIAGALAAIEPFWIAAQVVYVRKAGAEESGDDLRTWFEELRRSA